jgi:hypothetical protein
MGGYGDVEAFHNKFFDFHWVSNFVRQTQEQLYFEGWLTRLAPVFAFLLACALDGKNTMQQWKIAALLAATLFLSGMAVGGTGTWTWLAAFGLKEAWNNRRFLGPLIVVGFFVFFIVTPSYTPYARLYLPWIPIAQLLAGASLNSLFPLNAPANKRFPGFSEKASLRFFAAAAALFLILVFVIGARKQSNQVAWASSASSRDAAQELMKQIPAEATVFVVGEPQLGFYFRSAGYHTYSLHYLAFNQIAPDPIMYALSNSGPIYVIGGYYARDENNWRRILAAVPYRFQAVAKVPMIAGDIRLLDDFSPREAAAYKSNPDGRYNLDLLVMNRNKLK